MVPEYKSEKALRLIIDSSFNIHFSIARGNNRAFYFKSPKVSFGQNELT